MSRSLLKRRWRASPPSVRLLFCAGVSLIRAQRREHWVAATVPLFVCRAVRSTSGLALGARLYAENYRRQHTQLHLVDITDAGMNRGGEPSEAHLTVAGTPCMRGLGIVIIHANPPQFQLTLCAQDKEFLRDKQVVGDRSWELENVPPVWKHFLEYSYAVDVSSSFVARALHRLTEKPVTLRLHQLNIPKDSKIGFGSDGILRGLSIFDAGSSYERKKPEVVLNAFTKAFRRGEAELFFKISNEDVEPERFTHFKAPCAAHPGVRVLPRSLGAEAMEELYIRHAVYVLLHRSVGFGLTVLEIMRRGLHEVATGLSSNTDFMDGELAEHPVPYPLMPMSMTNGPCKGSEPAGPSPMRQPPAIARAA